MSSYGEKKQSALSILISRSRCSSLAAELSDRQLIQVIRTFLAERRERKKLNAQQQELEQERESFFASPEFLSLSKRAAELNIDINGFMDHHSGQVVQLNNKDRLKNKQTTKRNYTTSNRFKYFVSDKNGYYYHWRGQGSTPPSFKAAGCTPTNKAKFLAENLFITKKLFSDQLRLSLKVLPPSSKLRLFLDETQPAKGAEKRKAALLALCAQHNDNDNETQEEAFLKTDVAAAHLGYSARALKASRSNGKLGGRAAPPYTRKGRTCFYNINDLDAWLSQFKKTVPN